MNQKGNISPPELMLRFFRWFCNPEYAEDIEGDLLERFERRTLKHQSARLLLAIDVLQLVRPGIVRKFEGTKKLNYYGMFKSYLKTSLRSIIRNKIVSMASLVSLVIGTLCFHLIYLWVDNEMNTNSFHSNIDRVQVATVRSNPLSKPRAQSWSFFKLDYNDYPEIQKSLTTHSYDPGKLSIRSNGQDYTGKTLVADSTFFDFFDFPMANGARAKLNDPKSILITESFANRILGASDPIGKIIEINCDISDTYRIGGILKNIPSNSSIYFDVIIPRHSQRYWSRAGEEYFLFTDNFDKQSFEDKVREAGRWHEQFKESTLYLTPFQNIYFNRALEIDLNHKYGDINHIKTLGIISLLILVVCGLSFGNLQTTLQLGNSKKLGIKTINGASLFDLSIEMIIGRLYFFLAGTLLTLLLLDIFYQVYQDSFQISIDRNWSRDVINVSLCSLLIVGFSVLLSIGHIVRLKVVSSIKGLVNNYKVPKMQRFITTTQFGITAALIITTKIMYDQVEYMNQIDLGFEEENILLVNSVFAQIPLNQSNEEWKEEYFQKKNKYQYLINQLDTYPDIVTFSQSEPPIQGSAWDMPWKLTSSSNEYITIKSMNVDPDYLELMNLEMIEGRFFSDSLDQSRDNTVVLNEAALKYWGITSIDEAKLANNYWGGDEEPFKIVGVVDDYYYEHLSKTVEPLILLYMRDEENDFMLKYAEGKEKEIISFLEELYSEINPGSIFDFHFLEDELNAQYSKEYMLSKVYLFFTCVGVFLSLISFFAFALYETKRRTKEIGIRKISGATVKNILSKLGAGFLKPVALAYVIAAPSATLFVQWWLQDFSNRMELNPSIYLFSILVMIILVGLAAAWQSWRAATVNPVDTLKYE